MNKLLALGPDINKKDSIGRTALHYACRAGNEGAVKALLAKEEIEQDAVSNSGVTPLMCAVESGNISLVVNCLNAQMQPFVKDALNRDAMDYAAHFQNVQGHNM